MKHNSLFGALLLALVLAQTSFSQMGKVDTRYVSEESFFVIQFDIQKIIGYEKMGSKDVESIAKFLKNQAKFDLMNLKTVTLQFGMGEDPTAFGEDSFAVIMNFSKPVNQKEFLGGLGGKYELDTVHGKPFHKSSNEYQPCVFFPTDKSLVMGMKSTLTKLIAPKSGDAPMSALLNSAAPGSDIIGGFRNTEAFRNALAEIKKELPISPFNIEKVYGDAESGFLQAKLSSDTPLFLQINCKTEKAAEKFSQKTKLLVDLGKASIPLGREAIKTQMKEFGDDVPDAFSKMMKAQMEMANKGLDASEKILNVTSLSSQGKVAYLKVEQKGGAKELVSMVAKMLGAQFTAINEMQSDIEGGLEFGGPDGPIDDSEEFFDR